MNNFLEKIIAYKHHEVEKNKTFYPSKLLEQSIYFETAAVSMKGFLLRKNASGIIAEFKRASPSKGTINKHAAVETVSIGYMQAGASALSVLTDAHFFDGSNQDLTEARKFNYAPILYKNFIVDEYQLIEAKAAGADVILLIAECLTKTQLKNLATTAKSLGLEVLMELHDALQLEKLCEQVDIVGVNNRDLKSFEVSIKRSIEIGALIPESYLKISESGIRHPETVLSLRQHGFKGFLMGEHFMRHARPQDACSKFIKSIKQQQKPLYAYEN